MPESQDDHTDKLGAASEELSKKVATVLGIPDEESTIHELLTNPSSFRGNEGKRMSLNNVMRAQSTVFNGTTAWAHYQSQIGAFCQSNGFSFKDFDQVWSDGMLTAYTKDDTEREEKKRAMEAMKAEHFKRQSEESAQSQQDAT